MIHRRCMNLLITLSSCLSLYAEQSRPHILWGLSERQGKRPSMEDTYVAVHQQKNYQRSGVPHSFYEVRYPYEYSLFGIFDGHGGSGAAHLAAHYFAHYFSKPQRYELNAHPIIKRIFKETNNIILKSTTSGSTAVIAYIEDAELYLAWVGDSRAVLGKPDDTLLYETKDHKPNDPHEEALINARTDSQGRQCFISLGNPPRVNGILAVSRALGDRDIAHCITAEPQTASVTLESKYHKLLILACDGIWDVVSSQEALTLVAQELANYSSANQAQTERTIAREHTTERGNLMLVHAARALIDTAYKKGGGDNLSALVVLFDWDNTYANNTVNITPKNLVDRVALTWSQFWQKMRKAFGM